MVCYIAYRIDKAPLADVSLWVKSGHSAVIRMSAKGLVQRTRLGAFSSAIFVAVRI